MTANMEFPDGTENSDVWHVKKFPALHEPLQKMNPILTDDIIDEEKDEYISEESPCLR